jgi:hypothetical protein
MIRLVDVWIEAPKMRVGIKKASVETLAESSGSATKVALGR